MAIPIHRGQRVRVHVNLHRRRLSVVNPSTGRVIGYVDDITLTDVIFRHQPACVHRVQERGVRAVCAYAVGVVDEVNTDPPETGRQVKYNPFLRPDFHDAHGESVSRAARVVFTRLRAYAVAPCPRSAGTDVVSGDEAGLRPAGDHRSP